MTKLVEAMPGDEFYFIENKERIFTMLKYLTRASGLIYACRIKEQGKLYSIYISAYRNIIITKKGA
jgi:hypothetical protein